MCSVTIFDHNLSTRVTGFRFVAGSETAAAGEHCSQHRFSSQGPGKSLVLCTLTNGYRYNNSVEERKKWGGVGGGGSKNSSDCVLVRPVDYEQGSAGLVKSRTSLEHCSGSNYSQFFIRISSDHL